MSAKSIGLAAVIGLLLGVAGARGQDDPAPSVPLGAADASMTTPLTADPLAPISPAPDVGGPPTPPRALSCWILGGRPDCCGPIGGHGPIDMELFLRNGVSFPIAGAIFGDTLDPGWAITGGWRSLFFDAADTSAWTVELSITNICNGGRNRDRVINLQNVGIPGPPDLNTGNATVIIVPNVGVTIRRLNRTFVNLGAGKEWYLYGLAHSGAPSWRVGVDAGGRWGTSSLRTFELEHRNEVIGGAWFALHSDVEVPYGGFVFMGGLRLEWDYTWSDILQRENDANMQDLNLMINGGFRF